VPRGTSIYSRAGGVHGRNAALPGGETRLVEAGRIIINPMRLALASARRTGKLP
jgi:hypothetical protein